MKTFAASRFPAGSRGRPTGRRPGFLLPLASIFIVIALVMATGILMVGSGDQVAALRRARREQAFYLAEAGAHRAWARLAASSDWLPEAEAQTLGPGTFTVTRTDADGLVHIASTGDVQGTQETVALVLAPGAGAGGGGAAFPHGLFGGSLVYIDGSSELSGYDSRDASVQDAFVGSNTRIEIPSTGRIFGDAAVATGGQIVYPAWSPNAITGNQSTSEQEQVYDPAVIPGELLAMGYTPYGAPGLAGIYQVSSNNYGVANWPRVASILTGDYKFNNLRLANDAQLTLDGAVRLYLTGHLEVIGNSRFILAAGATVEIYLGENAAFSIANSAMMNQGGSPANLAIYSSSSQLINLAGTGDAEVNGVIYAPTGDVTVANSTRFRGAIIANQLRVTGNARVYHDVALNDGAVYIPGFPGDPAGGNFLLTRWTKPDWAGRLE